MGWPFSFEGKVGRGPYALWALGILFLEYVVLGLWLSRTMGLYDPVWSLTNLAAATGRIWPVMAFTILRVVLMLLELWVLGALSLRRAVDADANRWLAVLAVVPLLQIPAIAYLCFAPSRDEPIRPASAAAPPVEEPLSLWSIVFLIGPIAGIMLTLFSVAVGTLVFGTYGYALFVLSPFAIGCTTGYLANYREDIGGKQTAWSVVGATAVGSLALLAVALEGIVCIMMAAPLGLGAAVIGGALGRAIARRSNRSFTQSLSCVAMLPLAFAAEMLLPAMTRFDTVQSIVIDAPAETVWQSLLSGDPIEGPIALPFRLGVAYPLRSDVIGEGVGAVRRGEFSTGTAIERVTEWVPNRKFAFVVEDDIPALHEMSPYEHVHAPHVRGYFRTSYTSFELMPRPDGGTDMIERTSHELRLEPVLYWLPLARWMVDQNNARVLAHIRGHAERSVRRAGVMDTAVNVMP